MPPECRPAADVVVANEADDGRWTIEPQSPNHPALYYHDLASGPLWIREMAVALPDSLSTSITTAQSSAGPPATSNFPGNSVRKRGMMISLLIPITESIGPVIPTSVR